MTIESKLNTLIEDQIKKLVKSGMQEEEAAAVVGAWMQGKDILPFNEKKRSRKKRKSSGGIARGSGGGLTAGSGGGLTGGGGGIARGSGGNLARAEDVALFHARRGTKPSKPRTVKRPGKIRRANRLGRKKRGS